MNRRSFIGKSVKASVSTSIAPIILGLRPKKLDNIIVGHGDYKYRVNYNWAKLSSVRYPILNSHEMQIDKKGRLILLGDHTSNNILIFDRSGKLVEYWGTRFPGGHGLTLHNEGGEDFLYIVDSGWYLAKNGKWQKQAGGVYKTTIDGRLIFTLPDPRTIGVYSINEEYMPTETAIGPNGDIYVADGYGSDYILQYNQQGVFIRKWGGHKNSSIQENLQNAHGVTLDMRIPEEPQLICTSRNENSFKSFTLDGIFIKEIKMDGAYICRAVIDDLNIYTGVCWSKPKNGGDNMSSGFVSILNEGNKVISNPGGEVPRYRDGKLLPMHCSDERVFEHGHDVCVDSDKNLYVCQWNASGTPPVLLERI